MKALLLSLSLLITAAPSGAQIEAVAAEPSAARRSYDLLVWRPLGFVRVVTGAAMFVVAYPVGWALGGGDTVKQVCLDEPVEQVFGRPLGRD